MTPQSIFSWSKRPSSSEQYYRVGGLLPINTDTEDSPTLGRGIELKTTPQDETQQPSPLKFTRAKKKKPCTLSPTSGQHHQGRDSAASRLQAAFDDLLRSPPACKRPADLQKPLPRRPRSTSVPIIPELPVELPGSLLLENQGYPSGPMLLDSPATWLPSHNKWEDSRTSGLFEHDPFLGCSAVVPECIRLMNSVPNLSAQHNAMLRAPSRTSFDSSSATEPSPLEVLYERSSGTRRRSRSDLGMTSWSMENPPVASASGGNRNSSDTLKLTRSKVAAGNQDPNSRMCRSHRPDDLRVCVTPTPTSTRSKQNRRLKTSTAYRDRTTSVSTLQGRSLRSSSQPHAKATTSEAYPGSLEVPELHHSSSDDFLFLLDTYEQPQTPTREFSDDPARTVSSDSTPSFRSLHPNQQQLEMDSLKRKLSGARRPENTSRTLLPELNLHKQNNIALQRQIESLMAKLNDSKRREREAQAARIQAEYEREEWHNQVKNVSRFSKSEKGLQNTFDQPKSHREINGGSRPWEEEEYRYNAQGDGSPLDVDLLKFQNPILINPGVAAMAIQDPHSSTSNSNASSNSAVGNVPELSTFSAPVEETESLKEQIRQKNAYIVDLTREGHDLRQELEQLKVERDEATLRSDIQADLLHKTQQSDTYIANLRSAVFDREAIITEREKILRSTEKQLALHKLLLQAEIRRHAVAKINRTGDDDALPEVTTLAKQEDIDRWMSNLNRRLLKDQLAKGSHKDVSEQEAEVRGLRQEIEFYVREIIYYKLDIRGYKNDIRKLKRVAAQLGSHGNRASDLKSASSLLQPALTTLQGRFTSETPEPDPSQTTSPSMVGSTSNSPLTGRPITTKTQEAKMVSVFTPSNPAKHMEHQRRRPEPEDCAIRKEPVSTINVCYRSGTGSNVMDRPTPCPDRSSLETGEPSTLDARPIASKSLSNFEVLSDAPQRSRSLLLPKTPLSGRRATANRKRSASIPDQKSSGGHLSCPPRGFYKFSSAPDKASGDVSRVPQIDVLADRPQHIPENNPIVSSSTLSTVDRTHPQSSSTAVPKDPASQSKPGSVTAKVFSSPVGKLNFVSDKSVPLALSVASPHNHALITPTTKFRPSPCSITRNAPLKIDPPKTRPNGSGTAVLPSSVAPPVPLSDLSKCMAPLKTPSVQSVRSVFALPFREVPAGSQTQDENSKPGEPRTPSHSRTVSSSSIRTAIRLPTIRDKSNQKARMPKKDSLGSLKLFGSPLGVGRSVSLGSARRKSGADKAM